MSRKTVFRVLIVPVAVISLLAFLHIYYIRKQAGGELFWNANEAYIFMSVTQIGYRLSYLKYPLDLAEEALGGVTQPDDRHSSVLVIRVTRDGIQRYVVDNFRLGSIEPFEGALYAGNLLNSEPPMKWTGTQFERADPDELKRYYTNANKWPSGPSYDNVAGWSKRTAAGEVMRESPTDYTEKDTKFTIELGGDPLTFVMNSGFISHEAYVDLVRPGHLPERIWYLDERPQHVSRSEYKQTFKGQ